MKLLKRKVIILIVIHAYIIHGYTTDMNGAVIEFIVDTPMLNKSVKQMGDVSYIAGMKGNVCQRKIYKIYRRRKT